jgi:hypothetical protein
MRRISDMIDTIVIDTLIALIVITVLTFLFLS